MPPPLLLDSNILLLWTIGRIGVGLISRHKATDVFTAAHYEALRRRVEGGRPVVTASVLTEASNLLRDRRDLQLALRDAVGGWDEVAMPAVAAVLDDRAFPRLGFADAVILQIAASGTQVVTVDAVLHYELIARQYQSVNLHHDASPE